MDDCMVVLGKYYKENVEIKFSIWYFPFKACTHRMITLYMPD